MTEAQSRKAGAPARRVLRNVRSRGAVFPKRKVTKIIASCAETTVYDRLFWLGPSGIGKQEG